jgi:hypothetical protein
MRFQTGGNMSHQPFENWILDSGTLPVEDRRSLQAHLDTCAQCQRLAQRWDAVHLELRTRPMAAPIAGFTHRWKDGLAERRAREQRRQAWRIFGALLAGAVFILMVMAGYLAVTSSPTDWLAAIIRTADSSRTFGMVTVYYIQTWLASTPLALNIALWIYLTISLCVLSLVWVAVLWRTKSLGALKQ